MKRSQPAAEVASLLTRIAEAERTHRPTAVLRHRLLLAKLKQLRAEVRARKHKRAA